MFLICPACGISFPSITDQQEEQNACPHCGWNDQIPPQRSAEITEPQDIGTDETISFRKKKRAESEMDMTPMVDVVFLLLIFFMITASFGMQKSIEIPNPENDQSSQQAPMPEQQEEDRFIVVYLNRENRIFVEGEEAGTPQELHVKIRDRKYASGGSAHLLVLVDKDALHESVVRVLDTATGIGMDSIRLKTE